MRPTIAQAVQQTFAANLQWQSETASRHHRQRRQMRCGDLLARVALLEPRRKRADRRSRGEDQLIVSPLRTLRFGNTARDRYGKFSASSEIGSTPSPDGLGLAYTTRMVRVSLESDVLS